jgi:hypothetical protein
MSIQEKEDIFNNFIEKTIELLNFNNKKIKNDIYSKICNILSFSFNIKKYEFTITYYHNDNEKFSVYLSLKNNYILNTDSPEIIVDNILGYINNQKIDNFKYNDWELNYL